MTVFLPVIFVGDQPMIRQSSKQWSTGVIKQHRRSRAVEHQWSSGHWEKSDHVTSLRCKGDWDHSSWLGCCLHSRDNLPTSKEAWNFGVCRGSLFQALKASCSFSLYHSSQFMSILKKCISVWFSLSFFRFSTPWELDSHHCILSAQHEVSVP